MAFLRGGAGPLRREARRRLSTRRDRFDRRRAGGPLFQASAEQEASFAPHEKLADPEVPGWRTGRLQHFGLWARGFEGMRARFDAHAVPYRERTMPDKRQLVIYDPDSIEIEINFPPGDV